MRNERKILNEKLDSIDHKLDSERLWDILADALPEKKRKKRPIVWIWFGLFLIVALLGGRFVYDGLASKHVEVMVDKYENRRGEDVNAVSQSKSTEMPHESKATASSEPHLQEASSPTVIAMPKEAESASPTSSPEAIVTAKDIVKSNFRNTHLEKIAKEKTDLNKEVSLMAKLVEANAIEQISIVAENNSEESIGEKVEVIKNQKVRAIAFIEQLTPQTAQLLSRYRKVKAMEVDVPQ